MTISPSGKSSINGGRRLARLAEATNQYPVCERTIRRMISRGEITGYRMGRKILLVDLNEIDAALREIPAAC